VKCPNCGSRMVKRRGHSEFWGCSSYPNCRGTRQLVSSHTRREHPDAGPDWDTVGDFGGTGYGDAEGYFDDMGSR